MKRFGIGLSAVSLSILTGCGGGEHSNFTEPKQKHISSSRYRACK
jgi:hypothetical protein